MRHDRQPGQRDGEAQFHPVPLIRGAPRQRHSGRSSKPTLSGKLTSHAAERRTHATARLTRESRWPGCVCAWFCTSATVEGLARSRACWAAGQIGTRPTPANGCPQGIPKRRSGLRQSKLRTAVNKRPYAVP